MLNLKKLLSIFFIFFLLINQKFTCSNCLDKKDLCFKEKNYFIKKDYVSRKEYIQVDYRDKHDDYQREVYEAAQNITLKESCKLIADVGCGSGQKLFEYFNEFETFGFEVEPNFSYLKTQYPNRNWLFSDLKTWDGLPLFDIVICADVVEHLLNPDDLLNWINKLGFKYLIISTPDRDLLPKLQRTKPKQSQTGPPVNVKHIREWSFLEFNKYLSQYFDIVDHFHTKKEWWGQVVIARPKK